MSGLKQWVDEGQRIGVVAEWSGWGGGGGGGAIYEICDANQTENCFIHKFMSGHVGNIL